MALELLSLLCKFENSTECSILSLVLILFRITKRPIGQQSAWRRVIRCFCCTGFYCIHWNYLDSFSFFYQLKKIAKKSNPNQIEEQSNKRSSKSKKKGKSRNRNGIECDDKKRQCRRDCTSISDTPPHTPLNVPFSNQLQPFDNMMPMHDSYPQLPPPNLQPFYPTPPPNQQGNNYACLSPSDLPPPPYSISQPNYRHGDGMILENRMHGMMNFGPEMTSSFLQQTGHARQTHMQMLNHALNSY